MFAPQDQILGLKFELLNELTILEKVTSSLSTLTFISMMTAFHTRNLKSSLSHFITSGNVIYDD